jgi:hypothetical protein
MELGREVITGSHMDLTYRICGWTGVASLLIRTTPLLSLPLKLKQVVGVAVRAHVLECVIGGSYGDEAKGKALHHWRS